MDPESTSLESARGDPGEAAEALFSRAERALETGDLADARASLVRILLEHPGDDRARGLLDRMIAAATDGVAFGTYRAALREARDAAAAKRFAEAGAACARARGVWEADGEWRQVADEVAARLAAAEAEKAAAWTRERAEAERRAAEARDREEAARIERERREGETREREAAARAERGRAEARARAEQEHARSRRAAAFRRGLKIAGMGTAAALVVAAAGVATWWAMAGRSGARPTGATSVGSATETAPPSGNRTSTERQSGEVPRPAPSPERPGVASRSVAPSPRTASRTAARPQPRVTEELPPASSRPETPPPIVSQPTAQASRGALDENATAPGRETPASPVPAVAGETESTASRERMAILAVVQDWKRAFEAKNALGIKRVYPGLPDAQGLQRSFDGLGWQKVEILDEGAELEPSGREATVTVRMRIRTMERSGLRPEEREGVATFRLAKPRDAWVISDASLP